MTRILITGGSGFIGSHLALALQRKFPSALISVIDNFSSGSFKNLEGFKGDVITSNLVDLPQDFNLKFDYVFHLASISDTRNVNQQEQCFNNIEGFRALLSRVYSANENTRVIYASSASVYGVGQKEVPFREDFERKPENVYAFTKCQLENLARILAENAEVSITGVRFFNVYGRNEAHKGDYASMIRQMAEKAKGGEIKLFKDGSQRRDFVHVNDVVEMLILLMDYTGKELVFNCGSGETHSFNHIAGLVGEEFKYWAIRKGKVEANSLKDWNYYSGFELIQPTYIDCPYPFFQTYTCADMSLAKKELDFTPKHSNIEAIQKYIKEIYAS